MTLSATQADALRALPSVDAVLNDQLVIENAASLDRDIVANIVRDGIARVREAILAGDSDRDTRKRVVEIVAEELRRIQLPRLSDVINATGVIVHTNLGRAPVSEETAMAMSVAASRYTPLELEIETGKRGGRMSEISRMLRLLTGAEASLVVNNNAAAVLLVLSALCTGKDVVLSRSQAVEIGGGFRIPDVLRQSGASLVEVGTTNKTYVSDYANAISENAGALLAVHWSNFRIIGFTEQPTLAELSDLANSRSIPLFEDLGSGSLLETTPYGLSPEPTVTASIAAGVDVVCFSGDKLLGGPQAGIISGRADLVDVISKHPLARAVRADKTALAGVAATLRHYLRHEALDKVPVWRMISADRETLRQRVSGWYGALDSYGNVHVVETTSAIGGGSLPGETLSSWGIAIDSSSGVRAGTLARRLQACSPPVMAHIEDDRVILDARTVLPGQDDALVAALKSVLSAD